MSLKKSKEKLVFLFTTIVYCFHHFLLHPTRKHQLMETQWSVKETLSLSLSLSHSASSPHSLL